MSNYIKDLKKIVELNSYSHNKAGVDHVGNIFIEWLDEIDFKHEVFERHHHLGNHILFSTPHDPEAKKLLLLGHLDTVFAPGKFEGFKEEGEWVYGPGVCDMKGGLIVALEALREIHSQTGTLRNIDFLMVSDEEIGSEDSRFVTEALAKNYTYCFDFEAAGKNMEVVTARKGVGTYRIKITGKAAHAGVNFSKGINANIEAAHKLIEVSKLINLGKGTIINVGKIEGGIGANTISPHAQLLIEFRFDTDQEKERILAALKKITDISHVNGTSSTLEGCIQRPVMSETPEQQSLIQTLEKITDTNINAEHRGGVSDANLTAYAGCISIDGFGPYGDGDHTPQERALKKSFTQRIALMTKILQYHQLNKTFSRGNEDVESKNRAVDIS